MVRSNGQADVSLSGLDPILLLGETGGASQALSIGTGPGIVLAVAWIAVGTAGAVALERRGHDLRSLIGLAAVLGPLFLPLALNYVRDRDPYATVVELVPTPDVPGRRAIILLLGRPEAVADALPLLGSIDGLGGCTLATVVDYESAQRPEWDEQKQAAMQRLQQAAALLGDREAGQVLVPGTVERGVPRLATRQDDVIVLVGDAVTRGAERLSGLSGVPVISAPPTNRR